MKTLFREALQSYTLFIEYTVHGCDLACYRNDS